MSTAIPIPGPLSLGDLLDRAFRLYRSRFGSFLITAAVFLVPYALISILVTGSSMVGYFNLLQSLSQTPAMPPEEAFDQIIAPTGQFLGVTLLVALVGAVVNILVLLALTAQSIAALRGQPVTLGDVVRTALRRFWAYLGMMILSGLAFLGVVIVLGIGFLIVFGILMGVIGVTMSNNEAAGAAAAVGIFATIICMYGMMALFFIGPILYLSARWYVATPGIVDQEWGAAESLRKSWRLTRGSVLRCIGFAILLFVLGMIIVAAPVYVLQWMLLIVLPSDVMFFASGLGMAASSILNVLWQPLSAIAIVLLYFDLRVRQEGYDLTLRVQQLEAEMQPTAPVFGATGLAISPPVAGNEPTPVSRAQDEPSAPPLHGQEEDVLPEMDAGYPAAPPGAETSPPEAER